MSSSTLEHPLLVRLAVSVSVLLSYLTQSKYRPMPVVAYSGPRCNFYYATAYPNSRHPQVDAKDRMYTIWIPLHISCIIIIFWPSIITGMIAVFVMSQLRTVNGNITSALIVAGCCNPEGGDSASQK
uniref:Uncharacterized protein n=1 Tax=Anopheles coluzzii TaxID=1518534 RepID=A0A8W7PFI7_ANOCL